MNNKNDLRISAKNIRKSLDIDNISKIIVSKISNSEIFKKSLHIMIFYPLENEINLLPLLEYSDKNFYLPRINLNDLECCPYKINDQLKESKFKTKEPITNTINPKLLDLIFVPALMVDSYNYRLGYGKGYYDRFLEKTNAKTIVPIAKELVIEELPIDKHDKTIDIVLTQ